MFPILVVTGDSLVELIYYITPAKVNILTKVASNFKVINGIFGKGIPIEMKDLAKEQILNRKSINLDKVLDITLDSDVGLFYTIRHSNTLFRSFIFYPSELRYPI